MRNPSKPLYWLLFTMLFGFVGSSFGPANAGDLTEIEKKITQIVEQNKQQQIEHLEKVVNINSGTLNLAGNRELGKVYQSLFEGIDFTARWQELPVEMNRAGHFIASKKGSLGKRLLLIGHLDTVFEPPTDFTHFKRDGDQASGPGVVDMKGGNAIILYALKALQQAGVLDNTQIQVVFPGDEEDTGEPIKVSRRSLIDAAKSSDIALAFEGGQGGYATIGRRGFSGWHLTAKGIRAHSSGIFSEKIGAGAIFETSRILHEFYRALSEQANLTFNVGVILGGNDLAFSQQALSGKISGKLNIVAQQAVASGDLRYLSLQQRDSAIEKMQSIVANHLPQTEAKIVFSNSYPPMEPSAGNRQLLQFYSQVSQDLGLQPVIAGDPSKRGAGDISHVAEFVDSLDGLGAWGSGSHTTHETIDLNSLEVATKRAAILIYRLTR